ncbi:MULTISPECIES: FkbM family methyltransferase [unclassified Mesorhizobium]|uniref:FkbM family methyltransferase n=1 Tax=unclassified Mesorhizobium TaxID=325217 RepID=UPI0008ED8599|nr:MULTISPECIES: FkbM family methyltransferase [unclassified Mesorhizobium]SFU04604.1 methyltransferase, FkbM family [Mesorhizobium sp. YR577]
MIMDGAEASVFMEFVRVVLALGVPVGILNRGAPLRGTRFLAWAALNARFGRGRPFQMVNVGACDGALFDDVTPWLHRIPNARAVLVEPIPYNQQRLRKNYPDTERFRIEPLAITTKPGSITVKTFDAAALEAGTLPIEFIGCSSITDTNLMSGKNAWGEADIDFKKFAPYLRDIEVPSDTLQSVLDRNKVEHIDAFLVDCEGADWIVFDQLDLERYRPGMIKVEIGALPATEIGNVVVKLKTAGYHVGIYAEDIWAFS